MVLEVPSKISAILVKLLTYSTVPVSTLSENELLTELSLNPTQAT